MGLERNLLASKDFVSANGILDEITASGLPNNGDWDNGWKKHKLQVIVSIIMPNSSWMNIAFGISAGPNPLSRSFSMKVGRDDIREKRILSVGEESER